MWGFFQQVPNLFEAEPNVILVENLLMHKNGVNPQSLRSQTTVTFNNSTFHQVGECPEKRIICSEFGEISRVIYIEKKTMILIPTTTIYRRIGSFLYI